MKLAVLHGRRENLGCANCKGGCLQGTECTSLAPLQGWLTNMEHSLSDAGDIITAPAKALASTFADIGSGNFSKALNDVSRAGTSIVSMPVKALSLAADQIPGISGTYDAVTKFTNNHSEAIMLATAVIAATIVTLGATGVLAAGVTPVATSAATGVAATTAGVSTTTVAGALTTVTATVTAGEKLLKSNILTPTQKANVQTAVAAIKADPSYTSSIPWYAYLAPILFFL